MYVALETLAAILSNSTVQETRLPDLVATTGKVAASTFVVSYWPDDRVIPPLRNFPNGRI